MNHITSDKYIGPDDHPYWAIVGRDNISIFLKAVASDIKPIPNSITTRMGTFRCYISVAEPDTLFNEYLSNGVVFSKAINDNSDDIKGFEVKRCRWICIIFRAPKFIAINFRQQFTFDVYHSA